MHNEVEAIFQSAEIKKLEKIAIEKERLSEDTLMQRAGSAAFQFIRKQWPNVKKIIFFCGSGNNGGDGYATAALAKTHGLTVKIFHIGNQAHSSSAAKKALKQCEELNIPIEPYTTSEDFADADLIVDAMIGISLKSVLNHLLLALVARINCLDIPIFALDVPTGVDADNGRIMGDAIKASYTMTFIAHKLGLLTGEGVDYVGRIVLDTLKIPAEVFATIPPVANRIVRLHIKNFSPRPRHWHKGLSGKVLVVGGDYGYFGAPQLAGIAALRVGAGLVSIVTRPENAYQLTACHPELMAKGVKEINEIDLLLSKVSCIVLGPGLHQSRWSYELFEKILSLSFPLVMDADALNLLAKSPQKRSNWILTPHPGEAARLLHCEVADIQNDRLQAAHAIQARYGGVCVLKGAGSLICTGHATYLCDRGNPGMATAGMGDILSGVIGGLLAQGFSLSEAATQGVYLHAKAGDKAAKSGERGMIATDLLPYLRHMVNP